MSATKSHRSSPDSEAAANAPLHDSIIRQYSSSFNAHYADYEPGSHVPTAIDRSYADALDEPDDRDAKDLVNRAALRAAAQFGLDTMSRLYDQHETDLLSKGNAHTIDH